MVQVRHRHQCYSETSSDPGSLAPPEPEWQASKMDHPRRVRGGGGAGDRGRPEAMGQGCGSGGGRGLPVEEVI